MTTATRTAIASGALGWMVAAILVLCLAGCDVPPAPPKTADGKKVETVAVDPNDAEEVSAVESLLEAAGKYEYALKVLQAYYVKTGAFDQQMWTEKEMANFAGAQTFTFKGVSPPAPPPARSLEGAKEAALVEQVVISRRAWQAALGQLADLYDRKNMSFKRAMIGSVQRRFDPIRTYDYLLHAEIPPATLRPDHPDEAADRLFERALKLHRQGKPLPLVTDYKKQRQALLLFRQLVDEHPSSTKIALAAYYIADIYKEYFNENLRAVQWYQRAWQWDPNILKPARFQAAVAYDLRLAHYGKAVELYREVIKHEQFNSSNVSFATQRIKELTGQKP